MLGLREGFFRVHHPFLGAQVGEELVPRLGLGKLPTAPCHGQVPLAVEVLQPHQIQPPKTPREDADGQEEVRPTRDPLGAIGRQAPRRQDTMEMGMMMQLLAPGVEDGEATDLGSKMLGILSNVLEGLRDAAKEQAIEWAWVLQRQRPKVVRQGKDDMRVGRLEEFALPGRKPGGLGSAMTCGATPVPARVVRLGLVAAVVTLRDMAPEGRGPAHGDGAQGPVLLARQGRPIACEEGSAMLAHDIGDFEWWATHGRVSRLAGNARASRGLSVACRAGWATWR